MARRDLGPSFKEVMFLMKIDLLWASENQLYSSWPPMEVDQDPKLRKSNFGHIVFILTIFEPHPLAT